MKLTPSLLSGKTSHKNPVFLFWPKQKQKTLKKTTVLTIEKHLFHSHSTQYKYDPFIGQEIYVKIILTD